MWHYTFSSKNRHKSVLDKRMLTFIITHLLMSIFTWGSWEASLVSWLMCFSPSYPCVHFMHAKKHNASPNSGCDTNGESLEIICIGSFVLSLKLSIIILYFKVTFFMLLVLHIIYYQFQSFLRIIMWCLNLYLINAM